MNDNTSRARRFVRRLRCLTALLSLCIVSVCVAGCEEHDTIAGKIADAVSGDDKPASKNISGHWTGRSGSGRYSTVVDIVDDKGKVSGVLRWSWGGVRKFSGTRSGNSVQWTNERDSDGVQDVWSMTLSSDGNQLTGHATKSNGGGYSISLSR